MTLPDKHPIPRWLVVFNTILDRITVIVFYPLAIAGFCICVYAALSTNRDGAYIDSWIYTALAVITFLAGSFFHYSRWLRQINIEHRQYGGTGSVRPPDRIVWHLLASHFVYATGTVFVIVHLGGFKAYGLDAFCASASALVVLVTVSIYNKIRGQWKIIVPFPDAQTETPDYAGSLVTPEPPPPTPKALAGHILAELAIPQHIHHIFRYSIEWLIEDAATVPGWSFEKIKPIIIGEFNAFIKNIQSQYPLPPHPTIFSVPFLQVVKNTTPSLLYFSHSQYANTFPKLERLDNRRYERWKDKERKTFDDEMDYWLSGTPMQGIFYSNLPYELPADQRFAGMWLPIAPGMGKTNVLNGLITENLPDVAEGRASIFLMDSKSHPTEGLVDTWRTVRFEPPIKVHIFDPDDGVQINLFDLGEVDQIIDLFEYMFSSLLETMKLTDYQSLLLTKCVLAVKANPNPSILALHDMLSNGWEKYERGIRRLAPHDQEFFLKKRPDQRAKGRMVCDFDSSQFHSTRQEVRARLDRLLSKTPSLYETLAATNTKVDLRRLIDEGGNVIMVNASTKLLGDRGSEFWQRLWTMMLRNAADHRTNDKPVYVYWDEADTGAKNDLKLASLLDKCRSTKIAVTIAHQGENQISEPTVRAALERCAIKFESAGTTGAFRATIRGTGELDLTAVFTTVNALPKLTVAEASRLKEEMRRRYGRYKQPEPEYQQAAEPESEPFQAESSEPTATYADDEIIPPKPKDQRGSERHLPPPDPANASTDYEI